MPAGYETFAHKADVGVRGFGASLEEALEGAALALTSVVAEPGRVRQVQSRAVSLEEQDPELLLYSWLSEVVRLMDTERMLFSGFEVHLDGPRLRAELWGEPLDIARHEPVVEVKAATFEELSVSRDAGGTWTAQAVVDV